MIETWLSTDWTTAGLVVVSAVAIFFATILVTRVVGLRTFSKMSSFDFAVTVATGSIMATVAASSTSLANGLIALAALYTLQWGVAWLRRHAGMDNIVDNAPRALMVEGEFIDANLDRTRVTRSDVIAKLREANVLRMSDVRVVVLEATGDISVIHGDGPVDDLVLDGVVDARARPSTQ